MSMVYSGMDNTPDTRHIGGMGIAHMKFFRTGGVRSRRGLGSRDTRGCADMLTMLGGGTELLCEGVC